MAVLRPDRAPRRIQTLRQKEEAIEAIGIDALLVIPFTRDFSLTEPEDFVRTPPGRAARGRRSSTSARTSRSVAASAETWPCSRAWGPSAGSSRRPSGRSCTSGEAGLLEPDPPGARARGDPGGERDARPQIRARRSRLPRRPRGASDRRADHQPPARERAVAGRRRLCHRDRNPLLRPAVHRASRTSAAVPRSTRSTGRRSRPSSSTSRRTSTAKGSASSSSTACARSASSPRSWSFATRSSATSHRRGNSSRRAAGPTEPPDVGLTRARPETGIALGRAAAPAA